MLPSDYSQLCSLCRGTDYSGNYARILAAFLIATSTQATKDQNKIIADFATSNGLSLNESKTEIVLFSRKPSQSASPISLLNSTLQIIPKAKCLRYLWNKSLSGRPAVEHNITKARRQLFGLGSTGCYLGQSTPLTARTVVETCVLPTLCYGTENWILDDISLDLLNRFQSELGKRILRLSRFHSHHAPLLAPVLAIHDCQNPSNQALFPESSPIFRTWHLAPRTFHTLASQDIYSLSIVQQCIFLDSKLGTNATASILCNTNDPKVHLRKAIKGQWTKMANWFLAWNQQNSAI